jgi:hypothetical protein
MPAGTNPANVGSTPVSVQGWVPMLMPNGARMYPLPTKSINGLFSYNRMGPEHACLRYSNGQWTGFGHAGGSGESALRVTMNSTSTQWRQRFRVSRASRVVDGVFMRVARLNGTTGPLTVRLEQGPVTDAHNAANGTVLVTVNVPHTALYNAGSQICSVELACGANMNFTPYLWVPFPTPRTLALGTIYNLRLSVDASLDVQMVCSDGPDGKGLGTPGTSVATWDTWESTRQIPWAATRGRVRHPPPGLRGR